MLVPFTLGLLWPWIQYRRKRYQLENLRYGTTGFEFSGEARPFYAAFFRSVGLVSMGLIPVFVVLFAVAKAVVASPGADPGAAGTMAGAIAFAVVYAWALAVFWTYYATRITNYVVSHTSLPGILTLRASLRARDVFALELGNLLVVTLTLGLAWPWAAVRRARYRWEHVEARLTGTIETVTASAAPAPGALGEVAAEQLDIEISI